MDHDWGHNPSASELSTADVEPRELAKTIVRTLHLPHRAWTNDDQETKEPLRALIQGHTEMVQGLSL